MKKIKKATPKDVFCSVFQIRMGSELNDVFSAYNSRIPYIWNDKTTTYRHESL